MRPQFSNDPRVTASLPDSSAAVPAPGRSRLFTGTLIAGLLLAVLAAYANHFHNDFQFDDTHTITENPHIRDLRNIPKFFKDGSLFSIYPGSASYRPLTSTSLAIDYWLARGNKPFFFHLSTFVWFSLLLVLMFFLYRRLMDAADAHPSNIAAAVLVAACFGLHPACAETVNYIVQRADLYNTLGVVASLLWFIARPAQRKYGWYLLPALFAYLAKAPALIYPFILLAYVFLFEYDSKITAWRPVLRATLPAFAVTALAAIVTRWMTPSTFAPGAASESLYRLTQPWVALHYFKSFFLPTELTADAGWPYVNGAWSAEALAGYTFVVVLLAVAVRTARRPAARPIAFGMLWFFLALLPTALMPLGDVTNDHRMFFPFVGLALAVGWSLRLALFRSTARLTINPQWVRGALAAAGFVLVAAAAGTHLRNRAWHTQESLWLDATRKNPENGRAWMGYGAAFEIQGNFPRALEMYQRAERLGVAGPNVFFLAFNLAKVYAKLGRDDDAARYFERAEKLGGNNPQAYIAYSQWLREKKREGSFSHLETSVRMLLQKTQTPKLGEEIIFRGQKANSPESLLNQSAEFCKNGLYAECYAMAAEALRNRPGFAEAYANMSAALLAMGRWEEGIRAAQQALELKPDYEAARDNLKWGQEQQRKAAKSGR